MQSFQNVSVSSATTVSVLKGNRILNGKQILIYLLSMKESDSTTSKLFMSIKIRPNFFLVLFLKYTQVFSQIYSSILKICSMFEAKHG